MYDEQIEPEASHHRLDDDFGRAEPVHRFAAVEHQLQPRDADREHAETEPLGRNIAMPVVARMPNGRFTKNTQRQL
jgi:hypothetical protein